MPDKMHENKARSFHVSISYIVILFPSVHEVTLRNTFNCQNKIKLIIFSFLHENTRKPVVFYSKGMHLCLNRAIPLS